jgi:hypothetical protein
VSPEKIILFGSQVSKKTDQGSDLDLFIIQDGSQSNRQVRREIELMLQKRRFGLDLIVRTREEFELNVAYGNPFYVDVLLNSGQVVYESHCICRGRPVRLPRTSSRTPIQPLGAQASSLHWGIQNCLQARCLRSQLNQHPIPVIPDPDPGSSSRNPGAKSLLPYPPKPKKENYSMPKKNLPKKSRSSKASSSPPPSGSQHHLDSSAEQPQNLRTEYLEDRTSITAEKLEEPKLLFAGNDLDAFSEIDRAARTKVGHVDSWRGDLLGRRLSVTGTLIVVGWAIDEEANLPAKEVLLVRAGKILARSPVNTVRADVAAERSIEAYSTSGWTISMSGQDLGLGEHDLEIFVLMQDQSSVVRLGSKTVKVCPLCHEDPARQVSADMIFAKRMLRESLLQESGDSTQDKKWPKMKIDEASIKDGQLVVRGWAISPAGIHRVRVYLDGKLLAPCFYGHPRPDVKRSYPFVQDSRRSGFSLVKTIDIPNEKLTVCVKVVAFVREAGKVEFEKELPKDDNAALELLRQAAEKGDSWAEFSLGNMYRDGTGVPQNYEEALVWYGKASQRGNPAGDTEIAWMILRGQGVPQDTADALIRFQKLAQLHYEWAQFALGTIYRDGLWVPKDSLEAVKCFRMAAEQGNESAKAMLREMADSSK